MSLAEPSQAQDIYRQLEAAVSEVLSALRVLFVDDNTLCCRIGYRVLTEMGAEVSCATSGPEALALAEEQEFDVIVLDCAMPGMSGFDVARRLRRPGSKAHQTPIVGLATTDAPSVRQRALDSGIKDVVCKPISRDAVLSALAVAG